MTDVVGVAGAGIGADGNDVFAGVAGGVSAAILVWIARLEQSNMNRDLDMRVFSIEVVEKMNSEMTYKLSDELVNHLIE